MHDTHYPEVLQTLKDSVKKSLIEHGINADSADIIAFSSCETIRKEWGGIQVYISKGIEYELGKRDRQIWREFTGNNHKDLCIKYSLTKQRIYQIIKNKQKKASIRR